MHVRTTHHSLVPAGDVTSLSIFHPTPQRGDAAQGRTKKKENFYSHLVAPSKKTIPPSPLPPPPPPFSVSAFCVWWQTHPSPPPSLLAPQPTSKGAAEGVGGGREPKRCVAVAVAVVSLLGKVTRVIEDATRRGEKKAPVFPVYHGIFFAGGGRRAGARKNAGFFIRKGGGRELNLFFFVRNLPFVASIASRG